MSADQLEMAQHCGEMQYVCFGYSALSSWWNWIIPHQCTFLPWIHLLFQMYVCLQMHCQSFLCQRLNITILCNFSISHACTVDIYIVIYRYLYLVWGIWMAVVAALLGSCSLSLWVIPQLDIYTCLLVFFVCILGIYRLWFHRQLSYEQYCNVSEST